MGETLKVHGTGCRRGRYSPAAEIRAYFYFFVQTLHFIGYNPIKLLISVLSLCRGLIVIAATQLEH